MLIRRLACSLGSFTVALGIAVALPATAEAASAARQEPALTITKNTTTPSPLEPGQTVTYTLTVENQGSASTTTTVAVADDPDNGLTVTDMQGTGWTCSAANCSRTDSLPPGGVYPDITVTAVVPTIPVSEVCNHARVQWGPGNAISGATLCLPVSQPPAQLSISKTHSGTFTQGSTGTYALTVSNASAAGTTNGTVTVTDSLPTGVTYDSASSGGSGWTCGESAGTVTCTRSDPLAPGDSYPPITLTVNLTSTAPCGFINTATVSGGGSESAGDNDSTTVTGGTCGGGGGGGGGGNGNGGGGSILPIDISGLLPAYNNISINNPINSPGATSSTNQNFTLNGS
ncbi:hypothetical protein ABZ484_11790 [Streptomyces sp. NPDC006393]|uniref:hypothetical protein n=1 Tax=Streptomyces sp. NPDC006393 TaxID=3156763 RepID=UPI0033C8FDF9